MSRIVKLERPRSLHYSAGEELTHVRAGSGLVRWGRGFVVVQDDVGGVALIRGDEVRLVRLLAHSEHEGQKAYKADFEAAVVLPDGRLLVVGSGSSAGPRRKGMVLLTPELEVRAHDASRLYDALAASLGGVELNIEGLFTLGDSAYFVQRGNGAGGKNAFCEVGLTALVGWLEGGLSGAAPEVLRCVELELGEIGGVPLGLTDAAVTDDGRVFVLVGAEDSPDAYRDGPVLGAWIGRLDFIGGGVGLFAVHDDAGPTRLKLEGLAWLGREGTDDRFAVVADQDDPELPVVWAELVCG